MGVVQRQGFKRSVVTYAGVLIGIFSTLFIYPLSLESLANYGRAQFLLSMGSLIAAFATFGVSSLVLRYFPLFQDESSKHHGFLGLLTLVSFLGLCIFWLVAAVFRTPFYAFLDWGGFDEAVFSRNFMFILLISVGSAFAQLFELYASNFNRVAIPSIFSSLLIKVGLPVLILLVFWEVFNEWTFNFGLSVLMGLSALGLGGYLRYLGQWSLRLDWSFLNFTLLREMAVYAAFGLAGTIGSLIAFRIDSIMVTSLIGELENGTYSIANFIANVIEAPYIAMMTILGPILAAAMVRSDTGEVLELYRKSSLNLLIIGLYLFLGIWVCLDDLFRLTPRYEALSEGIWVVWWIGLAKLVTMTLGVSYSIIGYSRYFRFNLFTLGILAGLNVLLNYLLIPKYQITGAAMATAFSVITFQLVNLIFTWAALKFQPLGWKNLIVTALGAATLFIGQSIPPIGHPLVNILAKGTAVTLLFLVPVLWFRISPELNDMLQNAWKQGLALVRK